MARRRLIEDVKRDPQRYYRVPSDVNRDRRFSDEERLQILAAWERDISPSVGPEPEDNPRLRQLIEARTELETRRGKTLRHDP